MTDPIGVEDLDAFRAAYDGMTYAEHEALYSRIWEAAPVQCHYDLPACLDTIHWVTDPGGWEDARPEIRPQYTHSPPPITVVEVGGWDGALAGEVLSRTDKVRKWTNVEICREARRAGQGRERRYYAPEMTDWYWTQRWHADLLVASHCIEHMSAQHLGALIGASEVHAMWFDAPIMEQPTSWDGSMTTHVLNLGWHAIDAIAEAQGFKLVQRHHRARPAESGGHSTWALYEAIQ